MEDYGVLSGIFWAAPCNADDPGVVAVVLVLLLLLLIAVVVVVLL